MKKITKAFTLVELIISITILTILASISYVSVSMIYKSNIKNKTNDTQSFLGDMKSLVFLDNFGYIYVELSTNQQNNRDKYILGYNNINECSHINNIGTDIFDNYKLDDYNYGYFTGSILDSGTILLNIQESRNNIKQIFGTGIELAHDVSVGNKFIYNLYGTGQVLGENTSVKCGDFYVYYFDEKHKTNYGLSQIYFEINDLIEFRDNIILKYSPGSIKPDLYVGGLNGSRILYDKLYFVLKDYNNSITSYGEIN